MHQCLRHISIHISKISAACLRRDCSRALAAIEGEPAMVTQEHADSVSTAIAVQHVVAAHRLRLLLADGDLSEHISSY